MTPNFVNAPVPKAAADCPSSTQAQAQAKFNEGLALHHKGQLTRAQQIYFQVLQLYPNHFEAMHLLGVLAAQAGNHNQALEFISRSIEINPDNAIAYANRGNALADIGQYQAAIENYDQAIALKPSYAKAYVNRNQALDSLRKQQTVIEGCHKAPNTRDDSAEIYFAHGVQLSASQQYQAAIESYDKAIAIKPDLADAHFNRGNALNALGRSQAAIDSYDHAVALKPNSEIWHCARFATMMYVCDWSNARSRMLELLQNVQSNGKAFLPLPILALSTSLSFQRKTAEAWIGWKHPTNAALGSIPKRTRKEKIRIGYFSGDFCNHPVSFLTVGLFETHDRDRFEVYAFSFGSNTKDEMRTRLEAAFDRFIEVSNKSDKEVAKMARELEIDVAIDLGGLTAAARTGIFALRAAPLQVNYIGYSGTMGADYIDYLIADRQLIPEDAKTHYAEKIVYLPDTYMASDSKRSISDKKFTREELDLPVAGFVFCCFNNSYKITPTTFDGWMRN